MIENWKNKFFSSSSRRLRRLAQSTFSYGDKYDSNMKLYKSDLNGKCQPKNIFVLKPFESSCILDQNSFNNMINQIRQSVSFSEYGDPTKNVSDVTYIIHYSVSNNQYTIKKEEIKILYADTSIAHFHVTWNDTSSNKKDYPKGYLRGKPLKILTNLTDQEIYNIKGFFVPISDKIGNCIDKSGINNTAKIKSFLYQKNMMTSCKYKEQSKLFYYYIYKIYSEILKIGKYPNSKIKQKEDWIEVKKDEEDNNCKNNKFCDIKINLIIGTSKKKDDFLTNEYIKYVKIKKSESDSTSSVEGIISFKLQFVDVSNIKSSDNRKGIFSKLL
jgi:hypothetical protein